MASDSLADLGKFLTAQEAEGIATLLEADEHVNTALKEVGSARRHEATALMSAAGLGHERAEISAAVLRGIAGAKSVIRRAVPVWTMPGGAAATGHLTSELHHLVSNARVSVTCATYNFSATSAMWNALGVASSTPGVAVCVYLDSGKGNTQAVSAQLPGATIYRSAALPGGKQVVSHTKFVVIDHELVLLTSANFSFSAENTNVELGVLIQDSGLARSIETTMTGKHGSLYELV